MKTKNLQLLFHSVRVGPVGVRLNSPWIQKGQNSQYSPQSCLATIYFVLSCYSVSLREQTSYFLLFLLMARRIMGVAFSTEVTFEVVEERDTCQSEENLFPVLVGEEDHLYINGDNNNVIRRRMNMIEQIQNGSS